MTSAKEKVQEKKVELLALTMEFSRKFLNEEYEKVIEKLINKLARKRDVPFVSGRIEIWAGAVIHALGTVNFLFDKSTQPYLSATDIYEYFNTKQSTTSQKSKKIRDMFKMTYFDGNFSIASVEQSSPFHNLSTVNGLLVPQDRLNEKQVDVEEWEIQVAQIVGISGLVRGQKYKESYLYQSLHVKEESLMRFYEYLQQHLTFPFHALYEEEISSLEVAEYEINCIHLDQKMKVDEKYGIIVECQIEREKVILPLASMTLDEKNSNFKYIELYKGWFWSYR
ncbi:MAG: DUF6398 domain-containing protein [Bacillus sp. (in: firmicutes)]